MREATVPPSALTPSWTASHLILTQETVDGADVKNSYWLETEGLERCLQHIEAHGCVVETLTTDRHASVRVFLRDSNPHIWHEYYLWHNAKGVRKQLLAIAKPEVLPWVRAITHHVGYCATTAGGRVRLAKEKGITAVHHITNEHPQQTSPTYPPEEEETRPWLITASTAFEKVRNIIPNLRLLKDLCKYTTCPRVRGHLLVEHLVPKTWASI
ncbi:uncharacterized protein LOC118965491 isoform X1 [Oncorhynchus mykiss]|uniref:uncharacterized protein LOC118965491 isoform X1 n=1 Tax=Oncorhynchus mykiss TaxID=8022 RepID=UPI0018787777|nr:uncharacterized protein LOC118965491 isoform X1 [Oncorhynchus mykiss]